MLMKAKCREKVRATVCDAVRGAGAGHHLFFMGPVITSIWERFI